MKRIMSFVLMSVIALAFTGCGTSTQTTPQETPVSSETQTEATSQIQKVVVGLDENFPPMGFKENGELVGFDIDMATEAGKKMGVEMEFQPINWASKELELTSKRVDLLWNGFTITPARQETILFTKPYLKNKQVIMVQDNANITTKADLSGKKVGLQKDSSAVDAVNTDDATKQTLAEVVEYDDNIMAFQDLKIGRIDAVVVDEIVAKYYLSKNETNFILLYEDFGDEEYGVGMRMEDTELQKSLQEALDQMNEDGTAAKISEKWFGEDIVVK